jgi:hypothetical protein
MAVLLVLGVLDLLAGVALAVSGLVPMQASVFVLWIGILVLLKGLYSYLAAALNDFWFDVLGIMDIAVGVLLFLVYSGLVFPFFFWIGLALILKALWSIGVFIISA